MLSLQQLHAREGLEIHRLRISVTFSAVLPALPNLRTLDMSGSCLEDSTALFLTFPSLASLRTLNISSCNGLGGPGTSQLHGFHKYPLPPQLEVIDVRGTSYFEDVYEITAWEPATHPSNAGRPVLQEVIAGGCVLSRIDYF